MEVYQTDNHYIIQDGEYSLWCSRKQGTLEAKTGNDLCSAWNPVCIGLVYGVIGKIKIHAESDWKLLLISKQTCVGQLDGTDDVYQINKIVVLSLSDAEPVDIELNLCRKHHFGIKRTDRITQNADGQGKSLQKKTWNIVKSAAENVKPKKKEVKDKEKFERRILEELTKMYNETNSFYYCKTHDLTNTIQRQYDSRYDSKVPLCQRCDERFFWNLHMMKELTEVETELANHWILPIVQGCIDIKECMLDFSDGSLDLSPMMPYKKTVKDAISYKLILISRRSRHRAGTRSKRRGLDETGACSNYVETEQIIEFSHHRVSFVQVRGSIPVFWSQTGVKYRPPPKLDKGEAETYEAFKKHADEQLTLYKSIAVLTLAELTGKEKAIGDAFLNNVLKYNSQDVTYVTFDFHEYCRGMKFENVSILTSGIKDIIKHMRYCWVDRKGMICEQRGVFRVNCVDCLDRTNVVQTAIARIVMETQCRKLGLLAPDENLPENCRKIYQQVWANTGDAISKQYAGTAALKGDFTRTGERKITGMMKDGVNSANRYYLRFKDTYRQAAIDLTHGQPVSEDILSGKLKVPEEDVRELMEKEENVKMLIEDSKKMLIVEPEECLGGWSLINADPTDGDWDRQEMDIILLLSQRAVYVAWYDDEEEQVNKYQRIFLEDIEKIEIGAEPSLFKSKNIIMRLHYRHYADEGFFHSFRSPGTRLFNNLVITIKTQDEAKEQLNVVCEAFAAAQNILSLKLTVEEKQKLDKKKSLAHREVMDIHQQLQENSLSKIKLPRDISSSDIPSQASSRGTSPMFGRKLSPTPLPSLDESRNDQLKSTVPQRRNATKGAGLKSWLPTIPKLQKSANTGSFDLAVPKLNIKSLNIVGKIKSGKAGAGRLLSKMPGTNLFYRGDATLPVDEVDTVMLEDSESKLQPIVTKRDRKRTFSRDDSSIDEPPEITESELEAEVMLGSCGILATKTKQILESPQFSMEEETSSDENLKNEHSEKEIEESKVDANKGLSDNTEKDDDQKVGTILFKIGGSSLENSDETEAKLLASDNNNAYDAADGLVDIEKLEKVGVVTEEAMQSYTSTSFQCYCMDMEKCPHTAINNEEVWVKRTDSMDNKDKVLKTLELDLGQKRVIENSEADKILEKYSRSKKVLSHPNMRNSLSDSAIAAGITITSEEVNDLDSPKSMLEMDLEVNSGLQQKLPNLLQSSQMPRKCQRIYDNLKSHIQNQLGDTVCQSTIIFI